MKKRSTQVIEVVQRNVMKTREKWLNWEYLATYTYDFFAIHCCVYMPSHHLYILTKNLFICHLVLCCSTHFRVSLAKVMWNSWNFCAFASSFIIRNLHREREKMHVKGETSKAKTMYFFVSTYVRRRIWKDSNKNDCLKHNKHLNWNVWETWKKNNNNSSTTRSARLKNQKKDTHKHEHVSHLYTDSSSISFYIRGKKKDSCSFQFLNTPNAR